MEISDVKRLNVSNGDTLVFSVRNVIGRHNLARLMNQLKELFPTNKIVAIDAGIEITVLSHDGTSDTGGGHIVES